MYSKLDIMTLSSIHVCVFCILCQSIEMFLLGLHNMTCICIRVRERKEEGLRMKGKVKIIGESDSKRVRIKER